MLLDTLIAAPRLLEVDDAEVAAPPHVVWDLLRHGNLARSPLVRALFAVRTLPARLKGETADLAIRLDDLRSSPERPGFQVLAEDAPREFAVGAIGKVWHLDIPFRHVAGAEEFAAFDEPDFVKVAWAVRVLPLGERDSRIEFEVRVDATDDDAWRKFKQYFRLIGPGSHFIRRTLLAALERELGTPNALEAERPLPGDELLPDAAVGFTHGLTIRAKPERIWPWLLQMGCRRAGFYSVDWLDNGGARSAREIHPDLLELRVGQIIPATPEGDFGFEVLSIEPSRALVVGGLHDAELERQLPFVAPRPERFWQVTWAFVLEPLDSERTRLHVRARAAFPASGGLRAAAIRPVHHLMQTAMLKHLAARAEGRLPADDWRDVLEGMTGAAIMLAALCAPFRRQARSHWGVDRGVASRAHPGDELVPNPRWSWTHGVEISAPPERVWPWVAQIGAERGGFYSYQWLENLVGCKVRNAEVVHPEWELKAGDELALHPSPDAPRMKIVAAEPGRCLVAHAPADEAAKAAGKPWALASWVFELEPLGADRCRLLSRYRAACSDDLATRLAFGPSLLEPAGFAMDRRLLLGVKERVEGERGLKAL
jgi:hypothetical protein